MCVPRAPVKKCDTCTTDQRVYDALWHETQLRRYRSTWKTSSWPARPLPVDMQVCRKTGLMAELRPILCVPTCIEAISTRVHCLCRRFPLCSDQGVFCIRSELNTLLKLISAPTCACVCVCVHLLVFQGLASVFLPLQRYQTARLIPPHAPAF